MEHEAAVRCERLVKVYESATGKVQAVRGVDLEFDPGETAALVGPSGCGKSSLLRMLAGIDHPTAGSVTIGSVDLFSVGSGRRARLRAELVTYVHERPSDNLIGHLTTAQQLARVARPRSDRRSKVSEALEMLDLVHRSDHVVTDLSGGEQQRLAFARAIVAGHAVVIADEPTAQLDSVGAKATLDAMAVMTAHGMTVITATHDPRVLDRIDQIIRLRDGAVSTVTESGTELAVIDRSGRLQLPPAVQERFPDRRVALSFDENTGRTVIEPPPEPGRGRP